MFSYNDIGKKIKRLAKVLFYIAAVLWILVGIVNMLSGKELILKGLLIAILGPLLSWIGSWMTYGFGEIIDKLCDIERNTRKEKKGAYIMTGSEKTGSSDLDNLRNKGLTTQTNDSRICELENLRLLGLISEEEYLRAIAKSDKNASKTGSAAPKS